MTDLTAKEIRNDILHLQGRLNSALARIDKLEGVFA